MGQIDGLGHADFRGGFRDGSGSGNRSRSRRRGQDRSGGDGRGLYRQALAGREASRQQAKENRHPVLHPVRLSLLKSSRYIDKVIRMIINKMLLAIPGVEPGFASEGYRTGADFSLSRPLNS